MPLCMNGSTGDVRHDDSRDAAYEVHHVEAFAASTWCAECLLEYIESGMGGSLQFVTQLRQVEPRTHERVIRELQPLGIECKQS